MRYRDRQRADWRSILLEAFFVTLGVLLALAADEWREDHGNRKRAQTALAGIREELARNREAVEQSVGYHLHLSDTLGRLQRSAAPGGVPAAPPDGRLFARGFIGPAPMLETAWETASATDAVSYLPYEQVLALARLYGQQQRYEQTAEEVGRLIYTRLFEEGYGGMLRNYANLTTIHRTLWYQECRLLEGYAEAFAVIGDPTAAADTTGLPEPCRLTARR